MLFINKLKKTILFVNATGRMLLIAVLAALTAKHAETKAPWYCDIRVWIIIISLLLLVYHFILLLIKKYPAGSIWRILFLISSFTAVIYSMYLFNLYL